MSRRVWLWTPVIVWMAAIFVISGMSVPPSMPGGVSLAWGHALGYAVLAALVARALAGGRLGAVDARTLALAWLVSAVYGASDEFHQGFVPGRHASLGDWIVDGLGAAAALAAIAFAARIRRRGAGRAV